MASRSAFYESADQCIKCTDFLFFAKPREKDYQKRVLKPRILIAFMYVVNVSQR